jgi:aminopeptidase N
VIAAEAGITRQALVVRARAEGWKLRGLPKPWAAKAQGTRATLARFKALLQQRLTEFEAQIGTLSAEANAATSERDIRAMNTLVRTLEKVLELERKERARRIAKRKHDKRFDDAEREALAEKLMGLQREILAERSRADAARDDTAGDAGDQPRLADVGAAGKAAAAG